MKQVFILQMIFIALIYCKFQIERSGELTSPRADQSATDCELVCRWTV